MTQLLVSLRRLGCEASSGAGVVSAAQLFGIGEGTVVLYTRRCCTALFSLWRDVVKWPTVGERARIKVRLQETEHDLFEDCVGIVDGTFLEFRWKPMDKVTSVQYWSYRKKAYGLQATVICDDQKRITHFTALFPGAVHDARAFKATRLWNHPREFLLRGQFLLGDSAYPLTPWIIVPYKSSQGLRLDANHRQFNKALSALRVRIEHTIGQLKARWSFLRCIPNRGGLCKEDLRGYYEWIGSAVVLHNLLVIDDEWRDIAPRQPIAEWRQLEEPDDNELGGRADDDDENDDQRRRGIVMRDDFLREFLERQQIDLI